MVKPHYKEKIMENKHLIETLPLFPELNRKLIDLFKTLTIEEWEHSTLFPNWKVRDIAVHLLDTSIRRLSSQRDRHQPELTVSISSYAELARYITSLADRWSSAFTMVSPKIIIELTEEYQNQLVEFLNGLDPYGAAHFPVAWAGEEKSENWFDIAREYTERWHHQMQIRDVLKKAPLYERHLYYPLLDTFMQALPQHFRNEDQKVGCLLCVHVPGESGGKWFLLKNKNSWELLYDVKEKPDTIVQIDHDIAWKIFIKWIDQKTIADKVKITGDEQLGRHLLEMTCIMI
jgi:hypothetical protein